jgi:hypothetical protein
MTASALSDAEVAQRVAEGKSNAVPQRAARSIADIVRANVFTRINAILGAIRMGFWLSGARDGIRAPLLSLRQIIALSVSSPHLKTDPVKLKRTSR